MKELSSRKSKEKIMFEIKVVIKSITLFFYNISQYNKHPNMNCDANQPKWGKISFPEISYCINGK